MRKPIPILLAAALLLSGCGRVWADAAPIDELVQVETVGLDPDDAGVALSICASSPKVRETVSGGSVRLAMDAMEQQTGSAGLFYAHTKFLLLGSGADIPSALDFVARSSDMRLRTSVLLLKNATAAEAVQLGGRETDVTAILTALKEDMARHGVGRAFTCGEVLRSLSASGCALAAAAELRDSTLREAGYGILRDGLCVGWIEQADAPAVNLLLGLGGQEDVPLPSGAAATIDHCRRDISEGSARLTVEATLSENDAGVVISDDAARRELEGELCAEILRQVRNAILQSRTLGADLFGVGGGDVTITVRASIGRNLDLTDPIELTGTTS